MARTMHRTKFNDDLLIDRSDRDRVSRLCPSFFHAFDFPELREEFLRYEAQANRMKRRRRRAGAWTICLAALALVVAASEHLFHSSTHPTAFAAAVAGVAALLGAASGLVGITGLIVNGTKREWLRSRLATERLRQFHFQTMVRHLSDIARSAHGAAAKARFLSARASSFEHLKARLANHLDAEYQQIVDERAEPSPWIGAPYRRSPVEADQAELEQFLDTYRQLRIVHQLDYANDKLKDDDAFFSAYPRRQAAVIGGMTLTLIGLICLIHVYIVASAGLAALNVPVLKPIDSDLVNVVVITLAIGALAAHAFEQGLQPEREAERYQQYRSAVRVIFDRFGQATSMSEKLRAMEEMEQLSFDEMRNFLLTNERARFVM
jgi:hypothetical protein